MEITKEQMDKLRSIELEMLSAFIKSCAELNLTYFAIGGTLLGAVRHQGFIPWDDDIDVGMLRKDYEVWIKNAQQLLPKNLFLQTIYTEKCFPMNYAKIRNSDTTFIEVSSSRLKINHGIFIDVFPLDYYPDEQKERVSLEKKKRWLTQIASSAFCTNEATSKYSTIQKMIRDYTPWIISKNAKLLENIYKSCAKSSFVTNYSGAYGKKEIVPLQYFRETSYLKFENIALCIPKEFDLYLKHIYGDYMKLPPVEKRVPHHDTIVIDTEKTYVKYLEFKGTIDERKNV